jgi:drug/metabolite transporter (DMT)-like permease
MGLVESGWALALGAALGWSLFDLTRRELAGRTSAWPLVVWITVGALPLLLVWGWTSGDWRLEPSGYLLPGLGSTALNVAANVAYFRSLQLSPLSVSLPMLSLTPVFSAGFGALWLAESIGARGMAGIALVVAGAVLLSLRREGGGRARGLAIERGSALMAFVALCWSATLLLDKLALRHAGAPVHALVLNAGVALGGVVALGAGGRLAELGGVRRYAGWLAAAVACGAGALACQLLAIQRLPIGLVETLKRGLGGALAVVWGRACFAEPVTWPKLAAVALMVGGVALLLL